MHPHAVAAASIAAVAAAAAVAAYAATSPVAAAATAVPHVLLLHVRDSTLRWNYALDSDPQKIIMVAFDVSPPRFTRWAQF